MTDRERDTPRPSRDDDADRGPSQPVGSEDTDTTGAEELADVALTDDDFDEEDEFASEEIGAEADDEVEESTAALASAASTRARFGQRLGRGDGATGAALVTPSERAVRIDDRASQVYVLGVVATFVGILLFGMLWGTRGFFTTVPPSPSPSLALPSGSASPSPSVLPSAGSPSPSASSSTNPSAPPSPAGS